ncbi:uncharacterized protein LOC126968088 [Leptidea sinapis]|uniref:uncharacterized protein LOC126968088 n=1 Tax=Leptidea sinapis TaxID=189913 RepID=UPI0021C3B6D7|nr:uncharacterized protein LOC126968088 [Leptidea sinapis]
MDCAQKFPIDQSDIEQLRSRQMPDKENVKCLFACAYKNAGMMTEDGYLSVEGTNRLALSYLSEDPSRLKKAEQFTDACKFVNDENVSDDSKGCERAALIFKCSVEKAAEGMTDAQIKADFIKVVLGCARDNSVEIKKIMVLATYNVPNNNEVKCVLACAYQKYGVLNNAGLYDLDAAYKQAETYMEGDTVRLKNSKKVAEICTKEVNSATVSDGDKGCDRSALIFKCLVKQAPQYGFNV